MTSSSKSDLCGKASIKWKSTDGSGADNVNWKIDREDHAEWLSTNQGLSAEGAEDLSEMASVGAHHRPVALDAAARQFV